MGKRGDNEGSVFQRKKTGKWVAQVFIGYRPDGKRDYKTYTCATQREALEKLKAAHATLERAGPLVTKRQTVRQFLERWLEDVIKPPRAPRTYESYASESRRNIAPTLGHLQLDKVMPQDVQRFLSHLGQEGGAHGQGLSPRTVAYNRAILRKALNQALRWGEVARNAPTLIHPSTVRRHEIRPLDADQAHRFPDAARGDRLEALYTVAVSIGLREGEILGLRWEDVDLDRGMVQVRKQFQRIDGKPRLCDLKTESSRRDINLPPTLVAQLWAHRIRQAEERLSRPRWHDWNLIFPSTVGTPLDPQNLTKRFKALLAKAGLPDIRFHDLRHSCATLLFAQGVPLGVVQRTLGHSQVSLTMNTYVHIFPEVQKQAADAMERLLGGARTGVG